MTEREKAPDALARETADAAIKTYERVKWTTRDLRQSMDAPVAIIRTALEQVRESR